MPPRCAASPANSFPPSIDDMLTLTAAANDKDPLLRSLACVGMSSLMQCPAESHPAAVLPVEDFLVRVSSPVLTYMKALAAVQVNAFSH